MAVMALRAPSLVRNRRYCAPLKSVLIENAGAPLSELASRLRHRAFKHGKQTDDQTLLLIRRCGAV